MSQPPHLYRQTAAPSVPSPSTIADALLWDARFEVFVEQGFAFELVAGGVVRAFDVAVETHDGIAQLTVTGDAEWAMRLAIPDTTAERVANGFRFRAADGAWLTDEELTRGQRIVVVEGLDAIETPSVEFRAGGIGFLEPLTPALEADQPIAVGTTAATLDANIAEVFQQVLAKARTPVVRLELRVFHGQTISGQTITAPVVLLPNHEFAVDGDAAIASELANVVRQWLTIAHPGGTAQHLILGLTIFDDAKPRVRLTHLTLPLPAA